MLNHQSGIATNSITFHKSNVSFMNTTICLNKLHFINILFNALEPQIYEGYLTSCHIFMIKFLFRCILAKGSKW